MRVAKVYTTDSIRNSRNIQGFGFIGCYRRMPISVSCGFIKMEFSLKKVMTKLALWERKWILLRLGLPATKATGGRDFLMNFELACSWKVRIPSLPHTKAKTLPLVAISSRCPPYPALPSFWLVNWAKAMRMTATVVLHIQFKPTPLQIPTQ